MDPQAQVPQVVDEAPANQSSSVQQQIAEIIQDGKNILVTVGNNPSVDELASALGLTFMLGKLDKHITTVFSGEIPAAMEFLDPEATFESSVDSLRDFIIALDKDKADKLRYKVEDDVVKVFITPYRTVITEKDLQFSQGDFNVDVVVAIGVTKREDLDGAITNHGGILHDAAVVVINAGNTQSNLGAVDWNEPDMSSVAEMIVSLADSLGTDLLDEQISTAFLTGIVAETNRFSNEKTSPRVMTLSAQLMAAGANQQLIATNLRHEGMISEPVRAKDGQAQDDNGEMVLNHGSENTGDKSESSNKAPQAQKSGVGKSVQTGNKNTGKNNSQAGQNQQTKNTKKLSQKNNAPQTPTDTAASKPPEPASSPAPQVSIPPQMTTTESPQPNISRDHVLQPLTSQVDTSPPVQPAPDLPHITSLSKTEVQMEAPSFGGTLSATTATAADDAAEARRRERETNNIALSHDPQHDESIEAARKAVESAHVPSADSQPVPPPAAAPLPAAMNAPQAPDTSVSAMQAETPPAATPSPMDAFMQPQAAPNALNEGFGAAPVATPSPQSNNLPPLPNAADMPPPPPLPMSPSGGALPPLPPLPVQPTETPASFQPQINPAFAEGVSASQNTWTQAADEMAIKQAEKDATRQQKMDQMTQQYDQAVDRNRELQGLPPVNNPNGSGLPPLPPAQ